MTATSLVRDITWHDTSQLTTFNVHHVTSQTTRLLHLTPQPTSWHQNRSNHHHGTSPPWNSRRLVHSKEMVCASRWSVALRAFYRQILSLLYTTFFFWNFRPRLARELLVYIYIHIDIMACCVFLFLCEGDIQSWFESCFQISSENNNYCKWSTAEVFMMPFLSLDRHSVDRKYASVPRTVLTWDHSRALGCQCKANP